jgi:hypothetical protein
MVPPGHESLKPLLVESRIADQYKQWGSTRARIEPADGCPAANGSDRRIALRPSRSSLGCTGPTGKIQSHQFLAALAWTRGIRCHIALLEAVGLPSLGFLSDQGQHKFETEHGFTVVTVLAPSSLSRVAADLKRLLELVRENPMLAMDADAGGSMFSVDDVAQATARDYVSSNPTYDYVNVRGDEGQGPDYFFTWLRSVLRVVEVALSEGRAVIHQLKV